MDPYLMQMLGMVMQNRQPETIKDDSGLIMSNTGSLQGVGQGTGFNFPGTGQGMPQAAIMPGDQPGIPQLPNLPQLRAPQARSAGFTTGNILNALLGSNFGQK